jgi:hypothetical protein
MMTTTHPSGQNGLWNQEKHGYKEIVVVGRIKIGKRKRYQDRDEGKPIAYYRLDYLFSSTSLDISTEKRD